MPMFALVEPEQSLASVLPSTLLHGLLVAGAVVASQAVPVDLSHDPIDVAIAWPVSTTAHTASTGGGFTLPGAPTTATDPIPDIPSLGDLPTVGIEHVDPRRWVVGIDSTARAWGGDPRPGTQVLMESEVDDAPSLLAAGPLRYPAVLREAGIIGSVTVQFVIDTEGRVEERGIEVLRASHPGFVAAAAEAIKASRFTPARRRGEPVRVQVRQTVSFRD